MQSKSCLSLFVLSSLLLSAKEEPEQEEGSEFFVRADFNLPFNSTEAKLLYFLKMSLIDLDIAFGENALMTSNITFFYCHSLSHARIHNISIGAGIFVNIDKEHAMRKEDEPDSVRYGRMSLDDLRNKVPVKKDLFVICAAGK